MPAGQPQLRRDLLLSYQETPDGRFFVVKDPATRRFFRFGEAEHFIAQQLDGSTALEVIQQRVEAKFGVAAPLDTLAQFIARLRRMGLLQDEGVGGGLRADTRRRVRGSLLYLRLKAFDPDRLLERLVHKVDSFFTPYFLVVSAALILIALGLTLVHWGEIGRGLLHLYRFEALLFAWLTVLVVTTAHEFAHGLTCKRFGGEVHEISFLLLFFQPAFYCDVIDAWLFPEKAKRLWVTFSGAYFEIFLWALATLTWRITEPTTALHFLALVVMATSGIKTLFNLNPLIKLDGYYLLSDALEIPNLRQRSFRYLRTAIQKLRGAASQGVNEATPREQLDLVRVVSSIAGVITTPKLKEKLGQHMNKGDLIAQVHQLHSVTAEIPVSEKEIADVRVGERLVLKARAYPEHSFYGQVTAIAPTATKGDNGSGVHTILVTTTIDNAALLLKPEMTGNAKILCGRRRIVDLMTRRFARYIRVEF
jgi:Barrel-sandwich domain of CusB or HlyD membrane-fusion